MLRSLLQLPQPLIVEREALSRASPWHPAPLTACLCRVQRLQLHRELDEAQLGASIDLNEGRARRRAWQQALNYQVQHLALQLLVSIFR